MTNDDVEIAIAELSRRDSVGKLLYLNGIRISPVLAQERDYQRRFNDYYKLRQQPTEFYAAFYKALNKAALEPHGARLADVLQEIFDGCGKRHLSFSSKLVATVRDDAVVYDKNVAEHFGIESGQLPEVNWVAAAERRYGELHSHVAKFVTAPEWAHISDSFDAAFPEAAHLPNIRKADLVVWAHVGAQRPQRPS